MEALFDKGRSFAVGPVKAFYMISPASSTQSVEPVIAAFSVPSKIFKRAVDRNELKRRMREVYRQNKEIVRNAAIGAKLQCFVMFIYIAKNKLPYSEIESKLLVTLHHLRKKIEYEESINNAD